MSSKIAFITLPLPSGENQRGVNINEIAETYGVFPQLGLLRLASVALKEGHEVLFIDSIAEGLTPEEIVSRLRTAQADLLCLTLQTQIFPDTISMLRRINGALGCKVLGGGPHVNLYPRETMGAPEIDFALRGPAEVELPLFLRAFNGEIALEEVPGLMYRQAGRVVCNPPSASGLSPGEAPWPARSLLHHSLYYSLISQHRPYTSLISSFGCPYKCTFCEQGQTPSAAIPATQVVAEIDFLVRKHRVKEIEFFDPVFTLERNRVKDICQGLMNKGIKVKWSARIRVDQLDEELLSLMAAAGCTRLYVGIESASESILAYYNKEFSLKDAIRAVRLIQQAGIKVFGFFIFGAPEETEDTIQQTIQLSKELDLDYVQFNKLIAAPHTPLYEEFFGSATDYWGLLRPPSGEAPMVSKQFSEQELERWIRRAYLAFYFRPTYILKAIRRTQSPAEIRRAAKVALSLLGTYVRSLLPKR